MNRILVIYNPKANRGRNVLIADELQKHVMTQTKNGVGNWDVTWETTTHPGHATELALQAAQNGYQRIVSMGGDGTLHEIVNGLLRVPESVRPQLGVVPAWHEPPRLAPADPHEPQHRPRPPPAARAADAAARGERLLPLRQARR